MKVILAGFAKTGTKTIHAALEILGYEVYDLNENFWYLGKEWKKIAEYGGSVEDFKRMYKNVDATVDTPVFTFWEEIHQAFPDAKIILTTRDEDSWYKSLCKQFEEADHNYLLHLMCVITPTGRRYGSLLQALMPICFLVQIKAFRALPKNEMILKQKFRQHNAYVKLKAPEEKLLEYNVKEGWGRLCEFLDKDIPNQPFPHENKGAILIQKWMKEHPLMQRMKKELLVSLSALVLIAAFGVYAVYNYITTCRGNVSALYNNWQRN